VVVVVVVVVGLSFWCVGSFVVCLFGWLVVCLFVCLVVCLFVCLLFCWLVGSQSRITVSNANCYAITFSLGVNTPWSNRRSVIDR